MIRRCSRYIISLALLSFSGMTYSASGQDVDPYTIIDSVKARYDRVEDYKASIEIEVDVDFIEMPDKHAVILFKKPDRARIISDEFLMLPRRGINNRITKILEEPYSAIYMGTDTAGGRVQHLVRIVPMSRNPEIVVATWWVDIANYRVSRSESSLRKEGSFTIDFLYGDEDMVLPEEMVFTFEIERLSLPLRFIGRSQGIKTDRSKMKAGSRGKVYIRFSDYEVNSGLADELFD